MRTRFSPGKIVPTAALVLTVCLPAQAASEAEMLASAKVLLPQAVQIAERQEPGKAIGAEFDIERGKPIWEVQVLANAGLKEYKIDAASGAVVKVDDEHIRGRLISFLTGTNLKNIESARTPLAEAVSTAEKKVQGTAVKVAVEHERGAVQYTVFVRAPGKTEKVRIDAATGQPR
jgi:uncharacterized membrane protein YkoI